MGVAGRRAELRQLEQIYGSGRAELVAVYGRRRVGKTFLINQFFRARCKVLEVTAVKRAGLTAQLSNFATEVREVFGGDFDAPRSWMDAFDVLRRKIAARRKRGRIVLFLDELPWLVTQRSGCLEALAHFWNRHASRDRRVILVVCGSATSWMLRRVVSDRGGLHGRLTGRMKLLPFTLSEADELLRMHGVKLDRHQIAELYMAVGGVPKYLELARPGRSAAQIIADACFRPSGYLVDEFRDLYPSLFDRSDKHVAVVKALATVMSGMDAKRLNAAAGIASGGTFTRVLSELEESGFIMRVRPWGRSKKGTRYRLCDEYSLFYLRWIDEVRMPERGVDGDYWLKKQSSRAYRSWAGFAFEGICLKHVPEIKRALGIGALGTRSAGWPVSGGEDRGAQIDLVLDRDDQCINLFEIKLHRTRFRITKAEAEKLAHKRARFIAETATRKTVFLTMLTVHGVEENEHYHGLVTNQLTLDALFDG